MHKKEQITTEHKKSLSIYVIFKVSMAGTGQRKGQKHGQGQEAFSQEVKVIIVTELHFQAQ